MSNKKLYPKIDLRAVPGVPSCGCPFVENNNVICMNHTTKRCKGEAPYQFLCICDEDDEAVQSREEELVEIEA